MRPADALARRTLGDGRARTIGFALLLGFIAAANVAGYTSSYRTLADRLRLAGSFGDNKALRLFYGTPHDLATVGGYASWRVGGTVALFAAIFGLLSAVRALRGEEEAGRVELTAVGVLSRGRAFAARIGATVLAVVVLWVALLAGLAGGGLPLAGSSYLALASLSVALVYLGVGAVASQLVPSRRGALELGSAIFAVDFLVRVAADTSGNPWLHWLTPLGWAEELRPFSQPQPALLVLPLAATVLLLLLAARLERGRDIGAAVFGARNDAAPRTALLGSSLRFAFRAERTALAVWVVATGSFAVVIGSLSKSVAGAFSKSLRSELERLGELQVATPSGYIGLTFLFFVLAIALFCCGQVAAIRAEEAEGRLETLFSLPLGRARWLGARLTVAALGAIAIALMVGLGAAAGAKLVGAPVALSRLLEAGLNCLPASALFLGFAVAAVCVLPRFGVGIAYGIVGLSFVWELFGAILSAPGWVLALSPFHHIGLVPAQPFRATEALTMAGIGLLTAAAGFALFARRDLAGA